MMYSIHVKMSDGELFKSIDKILNYPKPKNILSFLEFIKNILIKYLEGEINYRELSDIGIKIFIINDNFFNKLKELDVRLLDLRRIIDITKPDWNKKAKINYIKEILEETNNLIHFYKESYPK